MMNRRNFFVGMGMGLLVGGATVFAARPKKRTVKYALGKTLKSVGDLADSVTDVMGW